MEDVNKITKASSIWLLTAGVISGRILALLSVLTILCLWFLVPNDPGLSNRENVLLKLKPIVLFTVVTIGLIAFSQWCVHRKNQRRLMPNPDKLAP